MPDEQNIVSHYRFDKALLIDSVQPELPKRAGLAGFGAFVVSLALLSSLFPDSSTAWLAFLIGCAAGYIYFDKKTGFDLGSRSPRRTVFCLPLDH